VLEILRVSTDGYTTSEEGIRVNSRLRLRWAGLSLIWSGEFKGVVFTLIKEGWDRSAEEPRSLPNHLHLEQVSPASLHDPVDVQVQELSDDERARFWIPADASTVPHPRIEIEMRESVLDDDALLRTTPREVISDPMPVVAQAVAGAEVDSPRQGPADRLGSAEPAVDHLPISTTIIPLRGWGNDRQKQRIVR